LENICAKFRLNMSTVQRYCIMQNMLTDGWMTSQHNAYTA